MSVIKGELIAKAENQNNSALIIEISPAVAPDGKGNPGKAADRCSITLPTSVDVSGLKRGKPVSITIEQE